MIKSISIPAEAAGERLDVVLAEESGISRSQLTKLFKAGRISVDAQPASPSSKVAGGETVDIDIPETEPLPSAPDLEVLYEDEDMLAVNKPAGLVVHLSESGRPQPTVAAFASAQGIKDDDVGRTGIVHRLDKDTSGILLIAKHPEAKEYLQSQFRNRKVEKTYLALVKGRLDSDEATINLPIGRSRKTPAKRSVIPGARASTTHYKVLKYYPGYSLLEIELETGRTHQIRVHMSHIGHPVVGDTLYGGAAISGLNRQFLHAAKLSLATRKGERLTIECPLPPDLQEILDRFEKEV